MTKATKTPVNTQQDDVNTEVPNVEVVKAEKPKAKAEKRTEPAKTEIKKDVEMKQEEIVMVVDPVAVSGIDLNLDAPAVEKEPVTAIAQPVAPPVNLADKISGEIAMFDFATLTELRAVVNAEYDKRLDEERANAQRMIEELAQQYGIRVTIEDGAPQPKHSGRRGEPSFPPMYHNPADQNAKTWSGRGRKPQWLVDALAVGADLETYRIPDAQADEGVQIVLNG